MASSCLPLHRTHAHTCKWTYVHLALYFVQIWNPHVAQLACIPGIPWLLLGTKHLDWKLRIQRAIGMNPEGLFLPCIGNPGRLRRWDLPPYLLLPLSLILSLLPAVYSPGPEHSLVLQDTLSVGEEKPRNPLGSHRNSSRFKMRWPGPSLEGGKKQIPTTSICDCTANHNEVVKAWPG